MADYNEFTDLELAAFLKEDNKFAFTEIYDRYSGILYVYAFKLTGNGEIAKDLIQELFISIWDNRRTTQFKTSLSSYLYSAVRYKFLREVSHQKIKGAYSEKLLTAMASSENTTEVYLDEKDFIKTVERLVSALPPKMARAFILNKLEFLSYKEVAAELNISEKTVQNLISEATSRLRPKMGLTMLALLLIS